MKLTEKIKVLVKSLFLMFFVLPISLFQTVMTFWLMITEYLSQPFNIFMVMFNAKYRGIYGDNFVLMLVYLSLFLYSIYILTLLYFKTKKTMKKVSEED